MTAMGEGASLVRPRSEGMSRAMGRGAVCPWETMEGRPKGKFAFDVSAIISISLKSLKIKASWTPPPPSYLSAAATGACLSFGVRGTKMVRPSGVIGRFNLPLTLQELWSNINCFIFLCAIAK